MPGITASSPLEYVGLLLLLFGAFLVLTGLNILKVEKVTVTSGRKTWVIGIVIALFGGVLLFSQSLSPVKKISEIEATSQSTESQPRETPPIPTDAGTQVASSMDLIYGSLMLENVRTDRSLYASGDVITITYDLVNRSNQKLIIPENLDYSASYFLVGITQRWVERLGNDDFLPSSAMKIGHKYAAGGEIIHGDEFDGNSILEPSERIPLEKTYNTLNFPEGVYRFYVEYESLDDEILQSLASDFTIQGFRLTPIPTNTLPSVIPPSPTPPAYTLSEVQLDQSQTVDNYGFLLGNEELEDWQEFTPTLNYLTAIELLISKTGTPGNLVVEIRDSRDIVLSTKQIPDYYISNDEWLRIYFEDPITIQKNMIYKIVVFSEKDNSQTGNSYTWRGNTASQYCNKCLNSLSTSYPDFDFALRSYGYSEP